MEEFLKTIIREAGEMANTYFARTARTNYSGKSDPDDIVTETDIAVSDFLIKKIHAQFPEHAIVSEELKDEINPGAEYRWVIDPVDGTRNFAAGIPLWGVLIAVQKNDEAILGAAYIPTSDQLFFAKKGGGAYLNGEAIHVSSHSTIDFAFGHCNRSWRHPGTETYIRILQWLLASTRVRAGNYSSILMMCYVASGAVDFVLTNGGYDHDYLAPTLIAREAGAIATNILGEPWRPGTEDVIVANPALHATLMNTFREKKLL